MVQSLLADLVLLLHLGFILFVLLGGLLVWYRCWFAVLHLPCVAWGVFIEFAGWICPLTPLEQQLRASAGEAGYSGSFIAHYLLPLIYPAGLTRNVQITLGIAVILLNLMIYLLLWRRRKSTVQ